MPILESIQSLLSLAVENRASDVHIKSNKPAHFRINGRLEAIEMDLISPEEISEFIEQTIPEAFKDVWSKNRQVDYSDEIPNVGRFRTNGFFQSHIRWNMCIDSELWKSFLFKTI